MKTDSNNIFWPSYVDLLTVLFIVMLVLFVLSYTILSGITKATEDELNRITEIQRISEQLPQTFFEYQEEYKRWILKQPSQFAINSDIIPPKDFEHLTNVGKSLIKMIDSLKVKYSKDSLKYLILIEGMSSRIGNNPDPNNLSYRRALSLFRFWKNNGIEFDARVCETIISGSGIYGIGRDSDEIKNQRILIQIIPKTSKAKEKDK